MQVTHPRALDDDAGPPPNAVDIRGRTVALDEDDAFETDDEPWVQRFAAAHDVEPSTIVDGWDTDDETDVQEAPTDDADLVGSFDPSDHKVAEIKEHIESIDGDDIVAELEAIRDAEVEGKERATAIEAIDGRLNDVRED